MVFMGMNDGCPDEHGTGTYQRNGPSFEGKVLQTRIPKCQAPDICSEFFTVRVPQPNQKGVYRFEKHPLYNTTKFRYLTTLCMCQGCLSSQCHWSTPQNPLFPVGFH